MPGGKGNCAVINCRNSTYKLNEWRNEICLEHGVTHDECPCERPFKLFFFPSKLRNRDSRTRWVHAMKRKNTDKMGTS